MAGLSPWIDAGGMSDDMRGTKARWIDNSLLREDVKSVDWSLGHAFAMSQRNWAEKPSGYEPARVYDVDDGPSRPDTIVNKRYSFFSCTEWVLEIVTSIESLVILAGVAVIFRTVDNQPLSH